ncbi:hypothetical protein [Methylobacterium currus]|uniref:hypothetical protein n=1 Tax=Methylobacterium currus TaxID=2051553 RepID=UPI0013DE8C0E|nr:hypothetical protein [Methylobacterium currus]
MADFKRMVIGAALLACLAGEVAARQINLPSRADRRHRCPGRVEDEPDQPRRRGEVAR